MYLPFTITMHPSQLNLSCHTGHREQGVFQITKNREGKIPGISQHVIEGMGEEKENLILRRISSIS